MPGSRPPYESWTYKDESWGAGLAKVTMRIGGKEVVSSLALSVTNRLRYMLHQQKT